MKYRCRLFLTLAHSETILEARENASSLREHIGQQLEKSTDLVSRLRQLDLPSTSIELEGLRASDAESSRQERIEIARPSRHNCLSPPQDVKNANYNTDPVESSFNVVLSASRVYSRVQSREVDAVSTILTTRSRAWSILSGLSLDQISIIAVIKLPLSDLELGRFWSLASLDKLGATFANRSEEWHKPLYRGRRIYSNISTPSHTLLYKRLNKELSLIERDPPRFCSAGLVGESIVYCPLLLASSSVRTID